MKITKVMIAECQLPIAKPIRLGPVEIKTRDFVVLRLMTDSGLYGDALSYPRGSALFESASRLAPLVQGTEVAFRRRTVDDLLQRFVNGRPGFVKAASLIDMALWDLAAKEVQQPLHKILGAFRSTVPVMVVAGYYADSRTLEDICDEVRSMVDLGFSRIKIMISGDNIDRDERLVSSAKEIAGERLCVDAHWTFRTLAEAYNTCRRLDKYELSFIEDPFAPHQSGLSTELQRLIKTPLAYGEDLPDLQTIHHAINSVPYLRLDATTCGGITAAIAAAEEAGVRGRSVLPHVFLPVHAQLAGSLQAIDAVEYIPVESRACPMFDLLNRKPNMKDGMLQIDENPGAGFDLNWSVVEQTSVKSFQLP
ncbi:mandelate racemase/muconate lactonizing enzyme family protein [Herbaspirillum frisingense]|uniref:mandelate racemase/muconate lactonizing enzyme family protein n=1 Tax=Herbaspirillum frisingense TaxID=92645 RepID=UPI001F338423|nr:enolase C-terminal domain-like protein [Herbaspirillum frisingense]UIN21216.1 hypothetical protein LAZ82_22630 [Herbaspirillum frisingense]